MTARVELRAVSQRFGRFTALQDINLGIDAGQFAVLLGASGCGKTTLLSVLGGFLTPTRGRVLIGERDVTGQPPRVRPTTTVFQDYALFPHMTLAANVGFGLRMRGVGRAERNRRARELLTLVGLPDAAGKKPHQLSGGQRQRVALARALAVEPEVLLLDEPLGALDLNLRRQMQDELKAIQKRVGTTFVHVTHDQEEAMAVADTVVVMNQGRVEDVGPPERIYLQPASRFSAEFMGDNNLFDARVVAATDAGVDVESVLGRLPVAGRAAVGDRVTLAVRPEHLHTEAAAARRELGRVTVLDGGFFGTHHQSRVALAGADPDRPLKLRLPQRHAPQPGQVLTLFADPADLVLLTR